LVSIGYKWLDEEQVFYDCYYHETEPPTHSAAEDFQTSLDYADVVVGQNIKFDLSWIRDCGFRYTGDIYDTMVAEYVLSKARRWPLGLAALAKKYDTVQKEKDLVEPFMAAGKTFFEIPWEIVKEYGIADVAATEQIALKQLEAFGTTFEELYNERSTTDIASVA
jgi:DNA polymerase I-like protein with 3'-5' exonuclease and polymerase domains